MNKAIWILATICSAPAPSGVALAATEAPSGDASTETYPRAQAQVKKRLDEIWATAETKDFARLESFHLYGPKFTEFKAAAPRGDAATNKKAEREDVSALVDPKVDMRDLAINVYGDTAIATFNGDFSAKVAGKPVSMKLASTMVFVKYKGDWKIVHEHFSPIDASTSQRSK